MDHHTPPPQQQWQPAPQPQRRRRGPAWVLPAVAGAALLVGVLVAAVLITGPTGPAGAQRGPLEVADVASLDVLFDPAAAVGPAAELGGAEPAPDARDRPLRPGPRGKRLLRLRDGEKVVAGSVNSAGDGKVVLRKDGGGEITVPTNDETRVVGAQNHTLSDLQAGERVIIKVGADGVADGILAVRAHAAGTVTSLDGDRATVLRPGGLSTVLDLSGVTERPAVGTAVIAVGTATDDGATLKVEQLRELPTLG